MIVFQGGDDGRVYRNRVGANVKGSEHLAKVVVTVIFTQGTWGTRPLGVRSSRARFGHLGGVLDALGHPRPWSAGDFFHFRIFHFRLPDLEWRVVLGTPGWA